MLQYWGELQIYGLREKNKASFTKQRNVRYRLTKNVLYFLQNGKILDTLLVILLFSAITNGAMQKSTKLTLQEIHLVRRLTYISHRYFAPGRSLVISSPATYRDVQQELTDCRDSQNFYLACRCYS